MITELPKVDQQKTVITEFVDGSKDMETRRSNYIRIETLLICLINLEHRINKKQIRLTRQSHKKSRRTTYLWCLPYTPIRRMSFHKKIKNFF